MPPTCSDLADFLTAGYCTSEVLIHPRRTFLALLPTTILVKTVASSPSFVLSSSFSRYVRTYVLFLSQLVKMFSFTRARSASDVV